MSDLRHLYDWTEVGDDVWTKAIQSAVRHRSDRHWRAIADGLSLGLVFFNSSLRTRTSMELAARELGAHVTTLDVATGLWGLEWRPDVVMDGKAAEHVKEAFGVLSRYYDGLGVRAFATFESYAQDRDDRFMRAILDAAEVPVVNLESAFYHPCQALGDAATLTTHFDGDVRGKTFLLSWAYHPRALPMAVPNSALLTASRMGMNVVVARPETHRLDEGVVAQARAYAETSGGSITETNNPDTAYEGVDVVYAKAWSGRSVYEDPVQEQAQRDALRHWRVTTERMARTRRAAFMHCLPVRRGVVVDGAVLDGPRAIHLLQAEFRLHAQKAILEYVWGL